VPGQLIPDGLLVTVPDPLPPTATERAKLGTAVNVAVTLILVFMVMTQVSVLTPHPPLHPAKAEPAAAEAVKVTVVRYGNGAVHWLLLALQLTPAGLVVTWPVPAPASATVKIGGPIKLPREFGPFPTAIVSTTVLVAVSITETVFEPKFAT
jgi:hypothetical protein